MGTMPHLPLAANIVSVTVQDFFCALSKFIYQDKHRKGSLTMRLLMKKLSPNMILVVIAIIILVVVLPLLGYHFLAQRSQNQQPVGGITATDQSTVVKGQQNAQANQLISRDVPAFATSGNPTDANDNSYDTLWWPGTTNAWLAYDLSRVPTSQRGRVLVVWYNESFNYDNTIINTYSYNVPQDYTIDVNPAPGGGDPPTSGWVTRAAVRGNHYHSRQHVIDMTGNNWIRINITNVDGHTENFNARINMDVYNASYALTDDWIFYGDSITAGAMGNTTINGVAGFAQLIHAKLPEHFPVQESGGIGYLTSSDGAEHIDTWLALFPGKYVALSYGTNDALGCVNPVDFYNNYLTMVQKVLNAGKILVVPHIPWGRSPNIQNCAPALNARIDALYKAFPQIIHGPDLWAFFQSHKDLISSDNIHPTPAGFAAYRQQWANAMLTEVYAR
jgi:GDSL-like Lipase/Acylhydrolase family